jgi:filamentous hemagglutinin family protein
VTLKFLGCLIIWGNLLVPYPSQDFSAHAATPITPTTGAGNLGTIVTPSSNVYGIRGGTTVGNNLYHSFAQFSVGTGDIAQYQTTNLVPNTNIHNILSRVTGGSPSSIFGTIDSATYYPGANFFFLNPAGILFGPNATINAGGMVAFTTADYLRLTDNVRFNAAPGPADLLLTAAPVAAFGFLGNNPAAIAIQGSTLKVAQGQGLSLVGGNQGFIATDPDTGNPIPAPGGITMTGGKLLAPGGQINIASVAGPGEISAADFTPTPGMAMGNINLSQGALLDVSADAAGTVRIRGGELVVDHATISADTGASDGAPVAIDINITNAVSLIQADFPALAARTSGAGNAGEILVQSGSLTATFSSSDGSQSLIDSHTTGTGRGGNVTITTGPLTVTGDPSAPGFFIDSGTGGEGDGGHVNITAGEAQFTAVGINTGFNTFFGNGSGGNLTIKTTSLNLDTVSFGTDSLARAGAIHLESTGSLEVTGNSFLSASGFIGGPITLQADQIHLGDVSSIFSGTNVSDGGDINLTARVIELSGGSVVSTQTFGDGKAGDIHLTASERVSLLNNPEDVTSTGLHTDSFGLFGMHGNAGNITITTPRLEVIGGARISSATQSSGRGGDVTIIASDSVVMSGERPSDVPDVPSLGLGETRAAGIYSRTVGSAFCSGPCGDAGHVSITTGSLTLSDGAVINNGTASTGHGGDVTVHATNAISISGTLADGTPGGIFSRTVGTDPGSGSGGKISLTAGQSVTMSNGASVSASSTGPGSTGNIKINAGNQFTMTNSSVTTEALHSSGGTIKIGTNPNGTVQLTNSTISASVLNGEGGGGSVNIDPQSVLLLNSQILANAVLGPGGNISITTNLLLPDANSVISASSQFGQQGTITIQSPIAPASRIIPLSQKPLIATSLLSQRCAALAGGNYSSFTVAGRDSLPAEPSGWLASPLAALSEGSQLEPRAQGVASETGQGREAGGERREATLRTDERREAGGEPTEEPPTLSLRRIAPPGFLTQAFAADWSGCTS